MAENEKGKGNGTAAVPVIPMLSSSEAAEKIRVNPDVFRFVNEIVLRNPVSVVGRYRMYRVENVDQVDQYLRAHDPRGQFRVKKRGKRQAAPAVPV